MARHPEDLGGRSRASFFPLGYRARGASGFRVGSPRNGEPTPTPAPQSQTLRLDVSASGPALLPTVEQAELPADAADVRTSCQPKQKQAATFTLTAAGVRPPALVVPSETAITLANEGPGAREVVVEGEGEPWRSAPIDPGAEPATVPPLAAGSYTVSGGPGETTARLLVLSDAGAPAAPTHEAAAPPPRGLLRTGTPDGLALGAAGLGLLAAGAAARWAAR